MIVNPRRAITPPGGPSRGRQAYRYSIVEHALLGSDRYSIRRWHPNAAIEQAWCGRERGWQPNTAVLLPKLYSRYGDAYRKLRRLQEVDAGVMHHAGRRRRLERMAPELLNALRGVLDSAEGVDHGRDVLARADRILNGN